MAKINHEEYEVLKGLDDKWKWIARDENRCLYVFTGKPVKKYGPPLYWGTEGFLALELIDEIHLFQFIQWENEEPHNIAELIEEYEYSTEHVSHLVNERVKALGKAWNESEETEMKNKEELKSWFEGDQLYSGRYVKHKIDRLDELERHQITLQDVTDKLWELPLNNRKLWLARLNDEFQEGYIVPLGLKTTDGEEQYLTYNGSYFASRRNKYLQQTFDTLEEIPEFYRGLAERVI